ncbi:rhomboid-like protein [Trypanosoma rangeli]|uniref:Rhomboid-like protein n=1 Tax=Trypanosoma rangeli TaxID=5698 RepID=A0A422NT79_TRYRA|nr:rhomboid-like protein [Trypanosoma rangeli]RNF08687.1 rhomboid-like protein [Trypanosoma rangeli]|eukprot:RNF08687.1 rhomboid-like protein [Trypanosoma rangeli]
MPAGGSVCRAIAVSLCVTAALSQWSTAIPRVFGLIPAHTFSVHSYPWNVFSYILVESNVVLGAFGVAYMLSVGAMVEDALGTVVFLQLILVTGLATAVLVLVLSVLMHQLGFLWFLQCFCGVWVPAAAVLVPWVAASPVASALPGVLPAQVRRRHLPTMLLALALVVDLLFRGRYNISGEDVDSEQIFPGSTAFPAFLALCISWKLQSVFRVEVPVAFSVLLHPIAANLLSCLALSRQRSGEASQKSTDMDIENAVSIPVLRGAANLTLLPGSTEEDAARRRSIALAALNSRLRETSSVTPDPSKRNDALV